MSLAPEDTPKSKLKQLDKELGRVAAGGVGEAAPLADHAEILRVNPQGDPFVLLTAVVSVDAEAETFVGYLDLRPDDFWVRGHMPGNPLLPGVLMCEAAAQLCSFYGATQSLCEDGKVMGLGGLDDASFRKPACPGDRLVLVGQVTRRSQSFPKFRVVGYVGAEEVFKVTVMGASIALGGSKGA